MNSNASNWPSLGLRFTLYFILVCSLVMWGLGIGLYIGVYRTPLGQYTRARYPARGDTYGFACALPMITAFATAAELVLYRLRRPYPIAFLVWGILSLAAWCFMFEEWFLCEYGRDSGSGATCPNGWTTLVVDNYIGQSPRGSGQDLWIARIAFAGANIGLYLSYMIISAIDMSRNDKAANRAQQSENVALRDVKRTSNESTNV